MSKLFLTLVVGLGLALAGCTGMRTVDADVQTFSSLAALPSPASFKFDRLPSQTGDNKHQADAERFTQAALTKVGLQLDEANARYAVQIGVRVQRQDRMDWPEAWQYWGFGGPHYWRMNPWPRYWGPPTLWYEREISLTLRDLQTGQVVYETHAHQASTSSDSKLLIPAMFDASLVGFPAGAPTIHNVTVQVPGT